MKQVLITASLLSLFIVSNTYAVEVNTHQAITRCATQAESSNQCNKAGAQNLHSFAESALLSNENYQFELFVGYKDSKKNNATYLDYAEKEDDFKNWAIEFNDSSYQSLIEAGVILEDALYPGADLLGFGGDGRFNNHFYAAQFNSRGQCPVNPFDPLALNRANMLSEKALCAGYGKRTDNITWALDDSVELGTDGFFNGPRVNDYGLHDAFNYYRASFVGTAADRKTNQAKLFVSLGFMIHMIQDLHSPAHVRDGSHPLGDYLEIYGRYDGGFNLSRNIFNPKNNPDIMNAIKAMDTNQIMLTDNNYSSYQDFFTKEANWVSKNFFSEAHNNGAGDAATGEGLEFDNALDKDTIFDGYNDKLAKSDTFNEVIPGAEKTLLLKNDKWFYIKSHGNAAEPLKGVIDPAHNVVAIVENSLLGSSERMMAVVDGDEEDEGYSYDDYDKTPLKDTAINVIPRAVASSEAFLNYFFRGQMVATLSDDEKMITIRNSSDAKWVSSPDLCTFKSTMKLDILYINKNGKTASLLPQRSLGSDLAIGDKIELDIGVQLRNVIELGYMGDKKQIIVLLDGQLGEVRAPDKFNIKAKGLVVTYASTQVTNSDVLFSFDKSGSMGDSIEQAKDSAKDILDEFFGIDNSTNFIEINAFSDKSEVELAYGTDISAAKAIIDTLFSDGGTALYDAIKMAGNNAVAHKKSDDTAKSIIILYADGRENNSTASKQAAIDAISKEHASEIDSVFLIFVGSDTIGREEMQTLASAAGRGDGFIAVDNAGELNAAISRILKAQ